MNGMMGTAPIELFLMREIIVVFGKMPSTIVPLITRRSEGRGSTPQSLVVLLTVLRAEIFGSVTFNVGAGNIEAIVFVDIVAVVLRDTSFFNLLFLNSTSDNVCKSDGRYKLTD